MQHPFNALKSEYSHLLAAMAVREECVHRVDEVAVKLLGYKSRYQPVSDENGVPVILIAALFEREASSNFSKNPAQGWPLSSCSKIIPHNGPFANWKSAALAAYHLNHLDQVGQANWTWELMCFYGEMFNGFGYRDYHHMHSPYLWGGTNIQQPGKYVSDKEFDPKEIDPQLGIVPVMRRMVELDSSLALAKVPYVPAPPIASGLATDDPATDTKWVQASLNTLGFWPELPVDGSYGFWTKFTVERFQNDYGLNVDGFAGPATITALKAALDALATEAKA
jgi:lysozyme family protein